MEVGRIPNKLKQFRRCHGYSQKKITLILGLSDASTLSRWEHGIGVPGLLYVFRLSRIYKTLPHELFNDLWNSVGSEKNLLALDEEPFDSNQSFFL
jgi:transcriptional regulator with XRE-family HTH domain